MIIKKSEKDERREKIIDVAFRLFVDKKIESVTMGEIAKEAGIGRATLFRYFPGKLELVIAVNTKEFVIKVSSAISAALKLPAPKFVVTVWVISNWLHLFLISGTLRVSRAGWD